MTASSLANRKSRRTLIDGRLVAAHIAPEFHGHTNTYDYHYCRCLPCADAKRQRRLHCAEHGPVARERKQPQQQVELAELVEEYEFMRGFRMSHESACKHIKVDPEALQRRFERNGYGHLIPRH